MDTIRVQNDVLDTARDEGRAEGLEEGRAQGVADVAKKMLAAGMDVQMISSVTGLSVQEIEAIRESIN